MPVKLSSTGGGSVTLDTPSTASNYTVTLPAANTTLADTSSTQTLTNKTIASLATTGTATFGGIVNTGSTGQVQFPATQNPSSDANTLDDYEEGTWTPQLNGGSPTYTVQSGWYVKIGRVVHAWGNLTITNKLGSTNEAGITGLPFSNGYINNMSVGSIGREYTPAGIAPSTMNGSFFSVEGTTMYPRQASGNFNNFGMNDFASSGSLKFAVTYLVQN